jgi:DNA-directed RNA polymerase
VDEEGNYKYEDPFQATADGLVKAIDFNFVDYSDMGQIFIITNDVDQEVYDDLDRFQYPLPMLIQPMPVTQNNQSGYVKVQGSIILKNNYHEDDVCLDHINRVNSIMLTINTDTAQMIQNKWKNLDKQKPGETFQDFQKRKRAFEKYDRTSRDVIDHLVVMENEFYLTHRYDKRGRTYCQGYHVNYQGTAWNKSVVEFADQEITNADH